MSNATNKTNHGGPLGESRRVSYRLSQGKPAHPFRDYVARRVTHGTAKQGAWRAVWSLPELTFAGYGSGL